MSIRTIKTPFTQSQSPSHHVQTHSLPYSPSLSTLSLPSTISSRPLFPLDMNSVDVDADFQSHCDVELSLQTPPGLESINMVIDSNTGMFAPAPVESVTLSVPPPQQQHQPQQQRRTRQRSGSFTYPSGCSYNHLEKMASAPSQQQNRLCSTAANSALNSHHASHHHHRQPVQPANSGSRRLTGRVNPGFMFPTSSSRQGAGLNTKSIWGPPPSASPQSSASGRFGFDPFGDESDTSSDSSSDEEQPRLSYTTANATMNMNTNTKKAQPHYSLPYHNHNHPHTQQRGVGVSASATSYNHYWQYDPSTNKPVLVFTPPPPPASITVSTVNPGGSTSAQKPPKVKANALKPLILPNSTSMAGTTGPNVIEVPKVPTFTLTLPQRGIRSPSPPMLMRPVSPNPSRAALSRSPSPVTFVVTGTAPAPVSTLPILFPPAQDKTTSHRKLALTLLNRKRVGPGLPPTCFGDVKKSYVKSGLSHVVEVDA